ncbi:alpha/beta hydrolase [Flavobacterium sp. LS1R47]|uniref:Alpha/beta hydrolase n=1 Tax=Flavobacterium frigoritolerans TaxID=2987686 RepID=A0A9X2ZKP5_9FLAO|nr:alpha/beta hydrolase [Flavobacterium frigoritolerans]MCV9933136.1 alpha/beta hydrolase [Flavobacterium frigoritolerans]
MKNYKNYIPFILLLLTLKIGTPIYGQNKIIPLWTTAIPNAINNASYTEKEVIKDGIVTSISQVTIPTLSIFLPHETKSNGTSVLIFPGGGYSHLSIEKEGMKVAKWLNTLGITAFVLKYRLPSDLIMEDKTIGPLQDAQEAIRFIRKNASQWNLDSNKIGVMGFSAGGHLASALATHYNDIAYKTDYSISARPSFSILIYPVIGMTNIVTHKGSQTNLLGINPSQELIDKFSNEKKVTPDTPAAFLVHATDDMVVPSENSINYYLALKNNKVSAELHLYEKGGHGFGLGVKDTSQFWTKDCVEWLKANSYL